MSKSRSRSIDVIAGGLRADDVSATLSDWAPMIDRRIYYPYFWFVFRYSARTLFGRTALPISCLVDARTRLGATTDPFTVESVEPSPRETVDLRLDETGARDVARRYSDYVMRQRRRALVAPEVDVVASALVYKPFWIVRCAPEDAGRCDVLVDGITGGFHALG